MKRMGNIVELLLIVLLVAQTDVSLCQSTYDQALSAFDNEDIEESIVLFNKAFNEAKDSKIKGEILLNLHEAYTYNYQDEEALELMQTALANGIFVENDTLRAPALHKMGVSQYNLGEEAMAIALWKDAIAIRKKLYKSINLDIIKGYRNIGTAFTYLSQLDSASYYLKYSLRQHQTFKEPSTVLLARTYADLARIYLKKGDVAQASNYLRPAESLFFEEFSDDPVELPIIYDLAYNYHYQAMEFDQAIQVQRDKIALLEEQEDVYDEDLKAIASGYNNIGIVEDILGLSDKAIESFRTAISYLIQLEDIAAEDQFDLRLNLMDAAISNDDLSLAESQRKLIKELDLDDPELLVTFWINSAEYYSLINDLSESDEYLYKVDSTLSLLGFEPSPILDIDILLVRAKIEAISYGNSGKGEYLEASGDFYRQAKEKVNQYAKSFLSDESKIKLNNKVGEHFGDGISTFKQLYDLTGDRTSLLEAFDFSEQAKSIALLSNLSENRRQGQHNIPADLIEKEKRIIAEMAQIQKEQLKESNFENQETIIQLNLKLESIKDEMYALSKTGKSTNIKEKGLQAIEYARDNRLSIIEYYIAEESIYRFYIHQDQMVIDQLPIDSLSSWIYGLRSTIAKSFEAGNNDNKEDIVTTLEQFKYYSHQLYQLLLPQNFDISSDELLIVPDGIIGYIPFDLLLTKSSTETKYGDLPYMIQEYNVTYSYSLAMLQEIALKHNKYNKQLLAFAPTFTGQSKAENIVSEGPTRGELLKPLYFNKKEVEIIGRYFTTTSYTGEQALENRLKKEAKDYQILHLSTHGKANNSYGEYAFLAFDVESNIDSLEDNILYNNEIYQLDLNAEMVVLSACETGIGELKEGEGVMSLARGFMYAGAKSVVTTLWSINDRYTLDIMQSFYENVKSGSSKSIALRNAKLKFIEDHPDNALPFYWAAFIPIGDMSPIVDNTFNIYLLGLATITILAFALIIFFKIYKSKVITK